MKRRRRSRGIDLPCGNFGARRQGRGQRHAYYFQFTVYVLCVGHKESFKLPVTIKFSYGISWPRLAFIVSLHSDMKPLFKKFTSEKQNNKNSGKKSESCVHYGHV